MEKKEKYNFSVKSYKNNYLRTHISGELELLAESNNFYERFHLAVAQEENVIIRNVSIVSNNSLEEDREPRRFDATCTRKYLQGYFEFKSYSKFINAFNDLIDILNSNNTKCSTKKSNIIGVGMHRDRVGEILSPNTTKKFDSFAMQFRDWVKAKLIPCISAEMRIQKNIYAL